MIAPVLLVVGLVGLVSAQNSSSNYNSQYTVPASEVDSTDKNNWCVAQRNSCLEICNNQFAENNCLVDDLSWQCVCAGGITTPNISSYQQTVPFFECQRWIADCQNPSNPASVQLACSEVTCATNDPSTMLAYYSSSAAATPSSTSAPSSSTGTTSTTVTGSMTTTATAAASSTGAADSIYAWSKMNNVMGAGAIALAGLAI